VSIADQSSIEMGVGMSDLEREPGRTHITGVASLGRLR